MSVVTVLTATKICKYADPAMTPEWRRALGYEG